jgi:prepilin-type N-terminal cleavage/methylation domain-containing protein
LSRDLRRVAAFTLIEMLVVISIIALLAAIGLPAIKGFGKSNAMTAAQRQMLDDLAYARLRAISDHTDVYMIFATHTLTNYLRTPYSNNLTGGQLAQVSNILKMQYSGYTFLVKRRAGDQPGQGTTNYLTSWRSLPEGVFIPTYKFFTNRFEAINGITNFPQDVFSFPSGTNTVQPTLQLPYIKFDYLGHAFKAQTWPDTNSGAIIIPLARGSIFYDSNILADVLETPFGNSSNSLSTRIRIESLTGRARVEKREVQ